MRELPILMNGPMVRATLDSRKMVTRRLVKPQPDIVAGGFPVQFTPDDQRLGRLGKSINCPCGRPGDQLWVRETWGQLYPLLCDEEPVFWRADYSDEELRAQLLPKWRPSIHMPRWASRITLEVTGVRVERLHEIEDGGCWDEGIESWLEIDKNLPRHSDGTPAKYNSPKQAFAAMWKSIYGASSWTDNSWVWVIEFKKLPGTPTPC